MSELWEDWGCVLDGSATADQRARIAAELQRPESQLRVLLEGCEDANVALCGPRRPVIHVSLMGFLGRHLLAFLCSIGILLTLSRGVPLALRAQATLWGVTAVAFAGAVWMFWKGWRELPFAGENTQGSLLDGLKGFVIGVWLCAPFLTLSAWLATDPQQQSGTLTLLIWAPLLFGYCGLTRGVGWREVRSGSRQTFRQATATAGLYAVLMLPWIGLAALLYWMGLAAFWRRMAVAWDERLAIGGLTILGVATCGVMAWQTAWKARAPLHGNWKTALAGTVFAVTASGYSAVPVAALASWWFGASIAYGCALGLGVAAYAGFAAGASQGVMLTQGPLVREHLRVGCVLLLAAVISAATASGAVLASVLIGMNPTVVPIIIGSLVFFLSLDPLDRVMRKVLSLPPPILVDPAMEWAELKVAWVLPDVFIGLRLLWTELQASATALRHMYNSEAAEVPAA